MKCIYISKQLNCQLTAEIYASNHHFCSFFLFLLLLFSCVLNVVVIFYIKVWHNTSLVVGQPTNYIGHIRSVLCIFLQTFSKSLWQTGQTSYGALVNVRLIREIIKRWEDEHSHQSFEQTSYNAIFPSSGVPTSICSSLSTTVLPMVPTSHIIPATTFHSFFSVHFHVTRMHSQC